MAIPRFYSPVPIGTQQTMELPQEIAHHAIRVLRLKPDSELVLFDGLGGEYPARLLIEGKKGYAQIGAHRAIEAELAGDITLAQGIPGGDKMDWIIEKAVELGARRLIPITAQRSQVQLGNERLTKRQMRWNRVAQAASEQCGRNRIMRIDAPCSLQDFINRIDPDQHVLFCHPEAEQPLAEALRPEITRLTLLVGPEGGWSDQEQDLVRHRGLQPIKFGTRILRTETAGLALIAACSALQHWS